MARTNSYFQILLTLVLTSPLCISCSDSEIKIDQQVAPGEWRFTFDLNGTLLPANTAILYDDHNKAIVQFKNGSEVLTTSEVSISNDSVIIKMPYFNTSLHLLKESDDLMTGIFINHDKPDYQIPVQAEFNKSFIFTTSLSTENIHSRYKVLFTQPSGETYDALLQIQNDKGSLTGTFRTETGDYRFLQGNIMNGKVNLSSFDGAHLFYFDAIIVGDSLTHGNFLSGTHYRSDWHAIADSVFELKNPESLTYLKDQNEVIDFKLLNQDGDSVSWSDLSLDNKVVILDIMGSWCPNCLDANRALYKILDNYPESKVSLIPIAFEYQSNFTAAKPLIQRALNTNDDSDNFLFGGKASKQHASTIFPMLNEISSFPTIIVIDQNRKVHLIYTGFNGPSTGIHYEQFIDRIDNLLHSLIVD